ncbi:MAG: hypothetical protein KKC37_09210, partial [Proteobacteria bacterium]|nr:hypothetical protein [Pseudomonadota bacterium]
NQAFRVPTHKIQLQNHLTLAAYLAAYHLRDLIDRQTVGRRQGRKTHWQCNLDNVVAAYNGSRKYIRGIRQKRAFLIKYLQGGRRLGVRPKKRTSIAPQTTKHPASTRRVHRGVKT